MLGAGACLVVAGALASVRVIDEPTATAKPRINPAAANLHLAKVVPAARRDIDYARLDARLRERGWVAVAYCDDEGQLVVGR